MSQSKETLVDRRTVERNIQKGLLSRKDYENHINGLPDVAPKGEMVHVEPSESADSGDQGATP
ncbi:MAG: hypothetical protein R3A78_00185 [Polyangiales bacterium]|nr:hypothetical protein [Myxococcales bacterium]